MTRFDVLQAMTDVEKYARHVWYVMKNCHDEKDVERIMRSELPEEGRQCILNAAQKGYPLSLERLQK